MYITVGCVEWNNLSKATMLDIISKIKNRISFTMSVLQAAMNEKITLEETLALKVTLEILAKDEDFKVRQIIARFCEFGEILAILAKDNSLRVREAVAMNPSTPKEILAKLAKDKYCEVRESIAYNEGDVPEEILELLVVDRSIKVRYDVARLSKLTKKMFEMLAKDKIWQVREAITYNDNDVPEEILEVLSKDDREEVRRAVRHRKYRRG